MAHGHTEAQEATTRREGVSAEEWTAHAAIDVPLQEALEVHTRRYEERHVRAGGREEGKRRKARGGA